MQRLLLSQEMLALGQMLLCEIVINCQFYNLFRYFNNGFLRPLVVLPKFLETHYSIFLFFDVIQGYYSCLGFEIIGR